MAGDLRGKAASIRIRASGSEKRVNTGKLDRICLFHDPPAQPPNQPSENAEKMRGRAVSENAQRPHDPGVASSNSAPASISDTGSKKPSCPECGSQRLVNAGFRYLFDGTIAIQRRLCKSCGRRFSEKEPVGSSGPLKEISNWHLKGQANISSKCQALRVLDGGANLAIVDSRQETPMREGTVDQATAKGKILELLWQLEKDGRKPGTIQNYRKWLSYVLKNNVDLFNPEDLKSFLAKSSLKDSTKANIVAIIDVWLGFAGLSWKPPRYLSESEIPFIPTEQELDQLITAAGKKVAVFLQLLKETGARCGEIASLKWTELDFQQRSIRIKPEKGSNARILPLSTKATGMLDNLPKTGERVFPSASDMRSNFYIQRRRIARKLANPRLLQIHFHTFRHWKGTTEYHKTKDAFYVKEILGHKSIMSTQVYIHIDQALYRNLPPDDFHVKVAKTPLEITELLECGFEYVLQKDDLAFFRKRK